MKDQTLPPNETYSENLGDLIIIALEPLKFFFEKLGGGGVDQKISIIGLTLHDTAVMQIEEALTLVDKQVGQVSLTGARDRNSKAILTNKLLSAELRQ